MHPHRGSYGGRHAQWDKDRCIRVGMDDYINKPINQPKIFDMLKKYEPLKNEETS